MVQETHAMELEIQSFAQSGISVDDLYEFKQRNIGTWKAKFGVLSQDVEGLGAYVNDMLTPSTFQQVATMVMRRSIRRIVN